MKRRAAKNIGTKAQVGRIIGKPGFGPRAPRHSFRLLMGYRARINASPSEFLVVIGCEDQSENSLKHLPIVPLNLRRSGTVTSPERGNNFSLSPACRAVAERRRRERAGVRVSVTLAKFKCTAFCSAHSVNLFFS
jgi:hypothetical protein